MISVSSLHLLLNCCGDCGPILLVYGRLLLLLLLLSLLLLLLLLLNDR